MADTVTRIYFFIFIFLLVGLNSWAAEPVDSQTECRVQLSGIQPELTAADIEGLCKESHTIEDCKSVEGQRLFHFDRLAKDAKARRILVMSLIHGDEGPSGHVSVGWLSRLKRIDARNHWRVIPVANPDGFTLKQRINKRGVDLNRNFPTKDWNQTALSQWKTAQSADPRRYPGPQAASEPETRCLMKHIEDFKPDLVISIHTPLGVLDFDGPKIQPPDFSLLPWKSLGNFPGSLGRYMWKDNNRPVLTVELKGNDGVKRLEEFDRLQDISGNVAIQSGKANKPQANNQGK